jgi:thiosulfate/3-mercaptopyruvate sulfurtransferase
METEVSKDSSALRNEVELRKLYESIGVTPDRTVVTYCGSGVQATQTYFTLKYLGYAHVRMYDGSFSEWTKANAPVEK